MTTNIVHGTYSGSQQHRRNGEKPCPECLAAATEYQRQYRHSTANSTGRTYTKAVYQATKRLRQENKKRYDQLLKEELRKLRG